MRLSVAAIILALIFAQPAHAAGLVDVDLGVLAPAEEQAVLDQAEPEQEALPPLMGVMASADGRGFCVIGDRLYAVGDRVGAYAVAEISIDRVTLRSPSGTRILPLATGGAH
jgi:hypothetical protein